VSSSFDRSSYITDNGMLFTFNELMSELSLYNLTIRYAGVGANHHNGVAERAIQNIMSIARTMIIHAAIHWPQVAYTQTMAHSLEPLH
jgi:hypothetical protein